MHSYDSMPCTQSDILTGAVERLVHLVTVTDPAKHCMVVRGMPSQHGCGPFILTMWSASPCCLRQEFWRNWYNAACVCAPASWRAAPSSGALNLSHTITPPHSSPFPLPAPAKAQAGTYKHCYRNSSRGMFQTFPFSPKPTLAKSQAVAFQPCKHSSSWCWTVGGRTHGTRLWL